MKITTELSIPIKVQMFDKVFFDESIEIGKIKNSYFKNNQLWVTILINSKTIKQIKKLLKDLKGLK